MTQVTSQSPQTGQVYFNCLVWEIEPLEPLPSQSPQTGQVYFNTATQEATETDLYL